jgi:hypothetical protein
MADFNNGLAVNGPLTISDEVTASAHFGSVVKAIIDDCSRHTDGGAWRKQCQGKSWFTETLGGEVWIGQQASIAAAWSAANSLPGAVFQATATAGPLTSGKFYVATSATTATEVFRGISRDYPDAVLWVAEASRVVGYDMTKPGYPMWMVFLTTTGYALNSGSVTSLAALNGELYVGMLNQPANIRFILDVAQRRNTSRHYRNTLNLSQRNAVGVWYEISDGSGAIVNGNVNDVAITVLDSAPTDPATGLPVPTIAVACGASNAGGVSIIRDDGTVASLTLTANHATAVSILGDRFTYSISNSNRYLAEYSLRTMTSHTIATLDATDSQRLAMYGVAATGLPVLTAGGPTGATVVCANNTLATGGPSALNLLRRNPTTQAAGMVSYITNTYNSGWQVGDSRGAYLADSVAETITASGELVTNGGFDTDTNWTKDAGWTIAGGVAVCDGTNGVYIRPTTPILPVSGRSYVVTFTVVSRTSGSIAVIMGGVTQTAITATGTYTQTINATSTALFGLYSGSFVGSIDNISVKLAEPDRSVKNNGLVVNGTLTKTAVASGAGLVAYSGFSASNYLEQPYSANLDFGTGDFCVLGWVNITGVGSTRFLSRTDKTGATFGTNSSFALMLSSGNWHFQSVTGSWATGVAATTGLHFVVLTFSATSLKLYIDNVLIGSTTLALNITSTGSPVLMLGSGWYNGAIVDAVQGSMALWRISATAPSADQIAHIYRTELPLFQPNAQCTLAGTTSSVTAMAYDDATNELHVTTAGSRSGFIDLLRVESETLAVGTSTTVAAFEGTVITGGTTSARVYAPALNLRDELRRKEIARRALGRLPVFFDYTATASQTAFVAPAGFTVKALYKNGTLMRETTTGVYWTRSNDGFKETATLSVGATVSDWISLMCVRA